MLIIEIIPLDNGAHRNQSAELSAIQEGWAIIPDGMETPNFPFGEVKVKKIQGVMTVTSWEPLPIPEPEPEPKREPTTEEFILEFMSEQEARICMLELGVV